MAVAGVSTIGASAFGVSKLVKSSGDDKKEEPIQDNPDDSPDKKVKPTYFILASIASLLFIWVLFCFIKTVRENFPDNGYIYYKPVFGLFKEIQTHRESKLGVFVSYFWASLIASEGFNIYCYPEDKNI